MDHGQRGRCRRVVAPAEQVRHRGDVPADVGRALLAARGRLVDLGQAGVASLGEMAAVPEHEAVAAAVDAEHPRAALGQEFPHFRPLRVGVAEAARQPVAYRQECQCDRQDGERAQCARGTHPAVRQVTDGLLVPEAPGRLHAEREPPQADRGVKVVGAQRGDRGAQRADRGGIAGREPGTVPFEQQVGDGRGRGGGRKGLRRACDPPCLLLVRPRLPPPTPQGGCPGPAWHPARAPGTRRRERRPPRPRCPPRSGSRRSVASPGPVRRHR